MLTYKCMALRGTSTMQPCSGWMGMAPYDYGVGLIALQCDRCKRLVVEPSSIFLEVDFSTQKESPA